MNWLLLEAQYTIEYHQQKFDILQMENYRKYIIFLRDKIYRENSNGPNTEPCGTEDRVLIIRKSVVSLYNDTI